MRYLNKALYSSTFCEFLAIYFHQEGDRSFHNLATDAANQGGVSCKTVRILTDEPQLKDFLFEGCLLQKLRSVLANINERMFNRVIMCVTCTDMFTHIKLGSKDLVVPCKVQYLRWRDGPAKGPWGLQAAPLNKEGIIHIIYIYYIYIHIYV